MMPLDSGTLIGTHVRLIPLEVSHAPDLLAASRDPAVWAYLPSAQPQTCAEMEAWVQDALAEQAQGNCLPFAIIDEDTQKVVGSTRFMEIIPAHRQAEIGWTWLTPAVWRTCVNTECKYLLLSQAFDSWKLLRVQFKTDARNERSQRAIERIGGVREGVLRRHRILHDGFVRDSVYYSIIADEWPSVQTRLNFLLADGTND